MPGLLRAVVGRPGEGVESSPATGASRLLLQEKERAQGSLRSSSREVAGRLHNQLAIRLATQKTSKLSFWVGGKQSATALDSEWHTKKKSQSTAAAHSKSSTPLFIKQFSAYDQRFTRVVVNDAARLR
jgi:hypothetical protein